MKIVWRQGDPLEVMKGHKRSNSVGDTNLRDIQKAESKGSGEGGSNTNFLPG